jgi:hypothetical protein
MSIVNSMGRVVLTPEIKAWMRRHLRGPFYDTTAMEGAEVFAFQAEDENPNVCSHCVANYLYDVLERAHRMKDAASGT